MEPFFLRCETCHARLRVRGERFLGQVQACPKCGSMVLIAAPAAAVPEAIDVPDPSPTLSGQFVGVVERPIVLWSLGAAVLLAGGIVAMLNLGSEAEIASLPASPPAVVTVEETPRERNQPKETTSVAEEPVIEPPVEESLPIATLSTPPPEPIAPPTVVAPPVANVSKTPPKPERTLTLEPVAEQPEAATAGKGIVDVPDYPATVDVDEESAEAKTQAVGVPERVTNVADQLAVPIASIDLPAMPIGEFVHLVSDMAAVPITLDPKVLGDAGLSTRSKVTVRAEDVSLGALLARVLQEHHLAYEEHDGALVVVSAKQR